MVASAGPKDPEVQHRDEEQIQDDVDKAGADEEDQRASGVADGLEDTRADVVDEVWDDPDEVGDEIALRLREHLLRGAHPAQGSAGEADPQ